MQLVTHRWARVTGQVREVFIGLSSRGVHWCEPRTPHIKRVSAQKKVVWEDSQWPVALRWCPWRWGWAGTGRPLACTRPQADWRRSTPSLRCGARLFPGWPPGQRQSLIRCAGWRWADQYLLHARTRIPGLHARSGDYTPSTHANGASVRGSFCSYLGSNIWRESPGYRTCLPHQQSPRLLHFKLEQGYCSCNDNSHRKLQAVVMLMTK